MRRLAPLIVIALLFAAAGAYIFHNRIWPPADQEVQGGAGGRAGDNIPKKRTGG
ncbi:hypothetical protein [Sphingomonas sp. G-3-2-10]|jgi:hypothetical protein|uniref:hypothetical protein n=1 Tax=Sphingomonas sp. G-3-2-10 TaxID=2728838 RepID=UPI00146CF05B|nr:hypothetical protein [Sphingomonas sp. G-3-2-10]NML06707.1 hypothetical protein [Sphingomonas sp. G-3-2-10]